MLHLESSRYLAPVLGTDKLTLVRLPRGRPEYYHVTRHSYQLPVCWCETLAQSFRFVVAAVADCDDLVICGSPLAAVGSTCSTPVCQCRRAGEHLQGVRGNVAPSWKNKEGCGEHSPHPFCRPAMRQYLRKGPLTPRAGPPWGRRGRRGGRGSSSPGGRPRPGERG